MVTNFIFVVGLLLCCKCVRGTIDEVPPVQISKTLTEVEIDAVKKNSLDIDQGNKNDWTSTFEMEADGLYEVAVLGIRRRAALAGINEKKLPISFYVSLTGYGGGSVSLMRRLEKEKYNIISLTAVDNPKEKDGPRNDNVACKEILASTQVKIIRLSNPDINSDDTLEAEKANKTEKAEKASFAALGLKHYAEMNSNKVLTEIQSNGVKFLVVALTSATFGSEDLSHSASSILIDALSILQTIAPVPAIPMPLSDNDVEVMSPASANGRFPNGTWLRVAKHTCTDVVVTVWPNTTLEQDSASVCTTQYFVQVNTRASSKVGAMLTGLEKVEKMYSIQFKTDIDAVKTGLTTSRVVKLSLKVGN